LTRRCLAILAQHDWPVVVQTRSPQVLRDIDILKKRQELRGRFSVTTAMTASGNYSNRMRRR